MSTFPLKTEVSNRFIVEKIYDQSFYYGFLYDVKDKSKKVSKHLIQLHQHLDISNFEIRSEILSNMFFPMEVGQDSGISYCIFDPNPYVPYQDYLEKIIVGSREFDIFFLALVEWLYTFHQHTQISIPYIHPDLIFFNEQTKQICLLGPFSFNATKIDVSVDAGRRFLSPYFLGDLTNTQTIHDYYPLTIMLLEALLGSSLDWNPITNRLTFSKDKIPADYQWVADFTDAKKYRNLNEDTIFRTFASFFYQKLMWRIHVTVTPATLREVFDFQEGQLCYPYEQNISHIDKNIWIKFPSRIEDPENEGCFFKLKHVVAPASFHRHLPQENMDYNISRFFTSPAYALELPSALTLENHVTISLTYEHYTTLEIVCKKYPNISIKSPEEAAHLNIYAGQNTWMGHPLDIPTFENVDITADLPIRAYVTAWEIDGRQMTKSDPSAPFPCNITLPAEKFPRQVLVCYKSAYNKWILGISLLAMLFTMFGFFLYRILENDASICPIHKVALVNNVCPICTPPISEIPLEIPSNLTLLERNEKGFVEYLRQQDGMVVIEIPSTTAKITTANKDPQEEVFPKFWIDKYEVSVKQYLLYLNTNKKNIMYDKRKSFAQLRGLDYNGNDYFCPDNTRLDDPITKITFEEAQAYAKWVGGNIPKEEEWCLAGGWNDVQKNMYIYPWGNTMPAKALLDQFLNVTKKLQPTTSFSKGMSPYGLYNMAGNVAEFCRTNSKNKICKGGSFIRSEEKSVKLTARSTLPESSVSTLRTSENGFRCVMYKE